jgi:type IV pilus assembly protein PilC
LNRGLDAGESITVAFGNDRKAISPLERSIIGAGERGGKLAPAFQHLADYFGMLTSARREVIKGLIYPIIILHLGIVIGILPQALMQGEMSASQILGSLVATLLVAYALAFLAVIALRAVLGMAPENAGIDRLINRIPWVGKARRNLAMARFCKVYHSWLLAGIPIIETAGIAAEASRSGLVRDAGTRLVEVAKAGQPLGPRFLAEPAFPRNFARSYATGEEAGTLDTDLARWSKLFQDDAESSVKSAAVMVPKVMYFFILLFVAWKIVGVYSGYYENIFQQLE